MVMAMLGRERRGCVDFPSICVLVANLASRAVF